MESEIFDDERSRYRSIFINDTMISLTLIKLIINFKMSGSTDMDTLVINNF